MIKKLWHYLNRTVGNFFYCEYLKKDGVVYVKEGFNPPEELREHMKKYHPKEYKKVYGK